MSKVEVIGRSEKRYDIKCPSCGEELQASRSIGMLMGIPHAGHGSCLICKEEMHLVYDEEKDIITTEKWSDYINEVQNK